MENRDIRERVNSWAPPERPNGAPLDGAYVILKRLNAASHASAIHSANSRDTTVWDHMPYGPFAMAVAYAAWVRRVQAGTDLAVRAGC